jgi:modulator of FtsH protease
MQLEPIRTNENSAGSSVVLGRQISAEAQKVLRNTYLLLALTMVPTIGGALVGMATGGIILQHPIIASLVMLAAVVGLQFAIVANRNSPLGIVLLLLMTAVLGWWIGPMLNFALALKNGAQLVGYAAAGTGIVLFAMATVATTTKRDFSFLGKFLFVGMIALVIAMFANMFLQIPALGLALSTIAIVIFSLFLLHDLSRIVTGGETNYIVATTGVYLSLLNIFMNLLNLLMALTGQRD